MFRVDDGEQLVGIGDIAFQLKITRQAVDYWTRKDARFPAPLQVINAPTGSGAKGSWSTTDGANSRPGGRRPRRAGTPCIRESSAPVRIGR
jgi:hypothetical protein